MGTSLMENIAMTNNILDVNHELFDRALAVSALSNLCSDLKSAAEFSVGYDGSLLSGGQRQRLSIARAIYRNTPVIFMDEFTSALDHETQHQIVQNINNILCDQTLFIISHRPEPLSICNKIIDISKSVAS
jgi:ABC-type bacteriocin/lantibiotic exporter with double-glycine peptidase domain